MTKLIWWLTVGSVGSLLMLLVLRRGIWRDSDHQFLVQTSANFNSSNPLQSIQDTLLAGPSNIETPEKFDSTDGFISNLFLHNRFSEHKSLQTWNLMRHVLNYSQGLPDAMEAIREASVAWDSVISSNDVRNSSTLALKKGQCPYFVSVLNATALDQNDYRLKVPCGFVQGSSVTIIGIPDTILGNFQIDLIGEPGPGEQDPPVSLHYNVRLGGDHETEDPVIIQNTWTANHGWGAEHRCPSSSIADNKKAEDKTCNQRSNLSSGTPMSGRNHFPFRHGYISVMTLRMEEDVIRMIVDGRHITSFAHHESQSAEPWLVSEVIISGDFKLIYFLASGLPVSEEVEHMVDLEVVRTVPTDPPKEQDLFVGAFSTANNFKRRMAVRQTWMQYPAVRSGMVAVRFFVGLHKSQLVNEALWNEVNTYDDIQLMPWVDYYNLITLKTVAVCIYGSEVASAKYIMKTDDDASVRIDEVLASLHRANVTHGMLYGLINSDSHPHRDANSKWYISPQEWPNDDYPPWAHGPGYVISQDIALEVNRRHKNGSLKMFKLEDVAMGIWIEEMKNQGMEINYLTESKTRINIEGCQEGYIVAHYQSPRQLLCLWNMLQKYHEPKCCKET